ncbi:MAG: hypothetical protein KGJ09_09285 [Candidatus Omnitrophica bacterium]|nr:hypothetical protein [Candidatus Omnitrophota bacterium]
MAWLVFREGEQVTVTDYASNITRFDGHIRFALLALADYMQENDKLKEQLGQVQAENAKLKNERT